MTSFDDLMRQHGYTATDTDSDTAPGSTPARARARVDSASGIPDSASGIPDSDSGIAVAVGSNEPIPVAVADSAIPDSGDPIEAVHRALRRHGVRNQLSRAQTQALIAASSRSDGIDGMSERLRAAAAYLEAMPTTAVPDGRSQRGRNIAYACIGLLLDHLNGKVGPDA